MATCKDMPQAVQHVLSSGLLCKGLQIEQIKIMLLYRYIPAPGTGLTVRGSLELHVHLANVIVHQVYLPIAHHPALSHTLDGEETRTARQA